MLLSDAVLVTLSTLIAESVNVAPAVNTPDDTMMLVLVSFDRLNRH